MARRFPIIAAPAYLILCILLGGASAAGAIANALLQAVGMILIVISLWNLRSQPLAAVSRPLLWVVGLFALFGLLSLVPLPFDIWTALPGRDYIEHGFALLNIAPGWQPLTLDVNGTINSLLALIVPSAMFLLVLQLSEDARRSLPWFVIGLAVVSVALGVFQLLGGSESPLRFYAITNRTAPVGFFANANHLATLTLCALPFAGYLAARAASRGTDAAKRSSAMLLSVGVGLFFAVAIAINGSLAGYGLFFPTAFAAFLIYHRAARGPLTAKWVAGLGVLFAIFVALSTWGPLSDQALSNKASSYSSRSVIAARTSEAIKDYLPVGSGLGTFQNVYRLYDDPNRTDREYVNHAHNDYLEVALELGVPGLLLVLAFMLWWLRRSLEIWRNEFRGAGLARAASVVIGIVLLHSIVDYPIRTGAIAALFGTACALLVPPLARASRREASAEESGLRHLEAT